MKPYIPYKEIRKNKTLDDYIKDEKNQTTSDRADREVRQTDS